MMNRMKVKVAGNSSSVAKQNPEPNASRRLTRWLVNGIAWRAGVAAPWVGRLLGSIAEERCVFFSEHKYLPHLRHPRTFSEKVCHRKLFNPAPQSSMLADKFAVRRFVAERGYPEILNELYLVTKHPEEIDFAKLPDSFVVKASHGSGWNIIVRNKQEIDPKEIVAKCQTWMKRVYGDWGREHHYREIPPAIIIERFLVDPCYEVPPDYKFYVFHGKCHFIQVDYDRFSGHSRTIYNPRWEPQEFTIIYPRKIVDAKQPATLDRMLEISEALARDIDFCRVDLYSVNDCDIYFGEITLTPEAGFGRFGPGVEADFLLGSLW
jgi:hypothetical protein